MARDPGKHGSYLGDGIAGSKQSRVIGRLAFHEDDIWQAVRAGQSLLHLRHDLLDLPIALESSTIELEEVNAPAVRKPDRAIGYAQPHARLTRNGASPYRWGCGDASRGRDGARADLPWPRPAGIGARRWRAHRRRRRPSHRSSGC